METIIIELNQRNADYQSKGEYRCKLATPVEINDGDSLAFRMCSLDSNKTDTDTIIIERDQPITGVFSYYDVDYELRDKAGYDQGNPTADPVPWEGTGGGTNPPNPYFDYFPVYAAPVIVEIADVQLQINNPSVPQGSTNQPFGGSFVFDTFTTFGNFAVDPLIQTRFTFSYLDPQTNLKFATYTGGSARQVGGPDNNPNFVPYKDQFGNYLYNFVLREVDGSIFQNLQCINGTFQLAGISGNWAGGQWSPSNKTYSAAADPPGKKSGPYDTTYPILTTDIGIYQITQSQVSGPNLPQLVLKTFNAIIPAGRYAPESLATLLTQQLSAAGGVLDQRNSMGVQVGNQVYTPVNPFLTRTDLPANADWVFRYNNFNAGVLNENITFVPSNTYTYYDFATGKIPSYAVGTSKFSVQFGQAGDVFQVSYMHMPISDPSKPQEEDIALYYTGTDAGTLKYYPIKSASGIAFHQLEPASFWDTKLGLSNKLIVPLCKDLQGTKFYYKTSLEQSVTYGFDSLGTYLFPATELPVTVPPAPYPYTNPRKMLIPPSATVTYFDVTGQSRAIIGETVSINTDGGFFLIEVLSAFRRQGSYIDTRESRPQITAVVSSQYDSNNAITGYSDSGVPFIHHGASYIISDCTVRILNPLTKQPATNLGENNCIWIQVDKAPQAQQIKQPQPQELHAGVQNLAMGAQTADRSSKIEKEQLLHSQLHKAEAIKAHSVSELAALGVEKLEQRTTLVEPQQSAAKGKVKVKVKLTASQRSELLQAMIARKNQVVPKKKLTLKLKVKT